MKKVIVTGASGFLGRNFVKYLLDRNIKVLAIGRQEKYFNNDVEYIKCDVKDIYNLMNEIEKDEYDTFIHLAWEGSAGKGRSDYKMQMNNIDACINCMKFAKDIGCKRFVCSGSIMEKEAIMAIDKQGNKPGSAYMYGSAKYMAHSMCKIMASDIGIELVWPLITNAYGVGEVSPRFINTTIRKIINKEPLEFTSAVQNYDFVYIDDVVRALYLICEKGKPFCEYVIGSSKAKPLKEFIKEMIENLDPSLKPIFGNVEFTGTNMPIETFNIKNLNDDTGFMPQVSFCEGIIKTKEFLESYNC